VAHPRAARAVKTSRIGSARFGHGWVRLCQRDASCRAATARSGPAVSLDSSAVQGAVFHEGSTVWKTAIGRPARQPHTESPPKHFAAPQPPRAPMPCPPLSSRSIQSQSVQAAARIRLQVIPDPFGTSLRFKRPCGHGWCARGRPIIASGDLRNAPGWQRGQPPGVFRPCHAGAGPSVAGRPRPLRIERKHVDHPPLPPVTAQCEAGIRPGR
jgi:hypothetical protein